jgi:2-(1,2-epoxy-1,2-dihydrophenyl)acetyl-CoA isomerase
VQGAGRAFCSGADVGGGALGSDNPGEATYEALTRSYNPTMVAIADLSVPVVSAVRGPAAGIGCSLALAADFCIASESAYFLQAFVNIGLVPDGGASWMLPRLIGRARATEMMMLGERVLAAKAYEWGMIHRIAADATLDAEAFALAERLAAGPTRAYGAIRRQLHGAYESDYAAAMAREAENQRAMRGTADSREGGMAFLEKRKPAFRGA